MIPPRGCKGGGGLYKGGLILKKSVNSNLRFNAVPRVGKRFGCIFGKDKGADHFILSGYYGAVAYCVEIMGF